MKTRGRPRKFDETEALDRALQVFWAKGYDAATLENVSRTDRTEPAATRGNGAVLLSADNVSPMANIDLIASVRLLMTARRP